MPSGIRLSRLSAPLFAGLVVVATLGVAGSINCCLEHDTPVRTPDGLRAIGDLQPGDLIISVDPESGAEMTSTVERVFHTVGWCRKLQVGDHVVWLTAEHPIYSPELGAFREAESWLDGELAATLGGEGEWIPTRGGAWYEQRPCHVVDLTVAREPRTFIAAGMVVHNKSPNKNECYDDVDCQAIYGSDSYLCTDGSCERYYPCEDDVECEDISGTNVYSCVDGYCR